jgi:hypothetical protein
VTAKVIFASDRFRKDDEVYALSRVVRESEQERREGQKSFMDEQFAALRPGGVK